LSEKYLLEVNVLAALTSDEHEHYQRAHDWLDSLDKYDEWAICPLTDAGYIRLAANPATRVGPGSIRRATEVLAEIQKLPGYSFWPITESWLTLTAPFATRISGHRQVTGAFLLGLAIREDGVLVTFERGLKYLAGPQFARNLLILDSRAGG
jgi:toxin-antitoxin system PIN domain toxin